MTKTLRDYRRDLGFHLARRLNLPLVKPDWVSVVVTLRCNLSCSMCRTCYEVPRELSRDEIIGVIDQVADWGVPILNLLGGEPFVRRDMDELLAHAHGRGLITTVTTNGTLIDEERAGRLAPLNNVHLNVSLDGMGETNDAIRGSGVFDRASAAIERVAAADAVERRRREEAGEPWWPREITLNCIVHRGNLDELLPLLRHVRDRGATGVQLLALFDHPDARRSPLWIGPEDLPRLRRVLDGVERWVADQERFRLVNPPGDVANIIRYYGGTLRPLDAPCYNGFKELYVNADGEGLMCDGHLEFLSDSFGNVRRQGIREMWSSPAARRMRGKVIRCTHACTQDCYRREASDSVRRIAAGAARRVAGQLLERGRAAVRGRG